MVHDAPASIHEPSEAIPALYAAFEKKGLSFSQENFVVLSLDARGRPSGFDIAGIGTMTACLVHPREVFRAAIVSGGVQIIICHNHPSGDATPSLDDETLTDRMVEAGKLLGIPVLDHIILDGMGGGRSCIR
jgi:DNA repair protein RadC